MSAKLANITCFGDRDIRTSNRASYETHAELLDFRDGSRAAGFGVGQHSEEESGRLNLWYRTRHLVISGGILELGIPVLLVGTKEFLPVVVRAILGRTVKHYIGAAGGASDETNGEGLDGSGRPGVTYLWIRQQP